MHAYQYLKSLQTEVGPRRAGTEGELRARSWLMEQLDRLGLPTEEREYRFFGNRVLRYAIGWLRISIFVLFIIVSRYFSPLVILAGITAYFLYFSRYHSKVMLRLARTRSQNLIAGLDQSFEDYLNDPDRPLILLCAHYDTPQNIPGWILRLVNGLRTIGPLLNLIMLALFGVLAVAGVLTALEALLGLGSAALEALSVFWTSIGFWILLTVFGLQLVITSIYILDLLIRDHADSPGADDNGSGVSLN